MYRLLYRANRALSSLMYWARRRFTLAGWAMMGCLVVTAIMGMNVERSVAYQAFTLLLSLMVLAMAAAFWFRVRFTAERVLPRFGSVGQPFPYRVVVRNESGQLQSGLWLLEELADPRPNFDEFVAQSKARDRETKSFRIVFKRAGKPPVQLAKIREQPLPNVPPSGVVEVAMELMPLRRGVIRFTGLTLGRPDPLGLFRALVTQPLPNMVLILPKRYLLPPIPLPGSMKYQQGGVALASSVGESEEFISLRDYRPGDPLRHIHWRSWAKTGEPIVKEFQDEFFVRHALILDTFLDRPNSLAFEEAVSVAASFACTVLTQESLLDLLFVGTEAYCFTAGRGLAHTEQILEILAAVQACRTQPFTALETLVLEHAPVVSGCIAVLLVWDEGRRRLLERLQNLGVPVLVMLVIEAGGTKPDSAALGSLVGHVQILEAGHVAEGLARMN
ncbi:MAG: DUF58 domain-containing protein [Verrucomicrobiota bacterium]